MRIVYFFLILIGFNFAHAQNDLFLGVSYGSSDIFRQDDASHYNYENSEFGAFALKEFDWKSNTDSQIKKYWIIQPHIILGNYKFIVDDVSETILRANLSGGIKLSKELPKLALHGKFTISSGYQTGYYHRLPKGVFFTEKLNLGVQFKLHSSLTTFVDIGAMHVSNANLHELNRGLEVFFVEVGFQIPSKSKQ